MATQLEGRHRWACGLVGFAAALFSWVWIGLSTSDALVSSVGASYLVRVGPAYAFLAVYGLVVVAVKRRELGFYAGGR
jgi:apolipoprotein N-acyltransferase